MYGMYNHFITIPYLQDIINNNLYPNDYLLAEQKYFYTYFLTGLAWLVKTFNLSVTNLFFVIYVLSLFTTLIAFFKLALELFRKREVAYFSVFLLIFSFTTLGDVRTLESLLLERTLVLPILLFSIYYYLKKNLYTAYILQGIAFLFHPLSTVYVMGFLFVSTLVNAKEIGLKKIVWSFLIMIVIASPALILKFKNPAPSLGFFEVNQQWIELLRLRSSHHVFPFSWRWQSFLQAGLFLVGFIITWKHKPAKFAHKVIKVSAATILLMCCIGTIFTEVLPLSIVIQFQLFRSFKFLVYFALLYYAHYFFTEAQNNTRFVEKIVVFVCLICIFYNANLPKFASFLMISLTIFPLFNIVMSKKQDLSGYFIAGQVAVILLLGIAGYTMRNNFTITNSQEAQWLDVQSWANKHTGINDLFIVPPNYLGFRVESERTIYGDWKDGTQMFFNPEFGKEWIRRMKMIGYVDDNRLEETYRELNEQNFKNIALEQHQFDKAFVVTFIKINLNFPLVYQNEKFLVYEIAGD